MLIKGELPEVAFESMVYAVHDDFMGIIPDDQGIVLNNFDIKALDVEELEFIYIEGEIGIIYVNFS